MYEENTSKSIDSINIVNNTQFRAFSKKMKIMANSASWI